MGSRSWTRIFSGMLTPQGCPASRSGSGIRTSEPAGVPLVALPAVAAAATAAIPPAATPAAAAPAAVLPGPGLVDRQVAAVDLLAVQRRDGRLGLLVGAH